MSSFVFILPLNLLRNLARKPNVWVISGVVTPNPHNWAPVLPMSAADCHHRCSFLCKVVQHHLQHLRGEGMVQGPSDEIPGFAGETPQTLQETYGF